MYMLQKLLLAVFHDINEHYKSDHNFQTSLLGCQETNVMWFGPLGSILTCTNCHGPTSSSRGHHQAPHDERWKPWDHLDDISFKYSNIADATSIIHVFSLGAFLWILKPGTCWTQKTNWNWYELVKYGWDSGFTDTDIAHIRRSFHLSIWYFWGDYYGSNHWEPQRQLKTKRGFFDSQKLHLCGYLSQYPGI